MRPIKLTLSAFGPYAEKQVIDFASLPENLFIITGDTGAGKTMIFDAICYALYGCSSGKSRETNTFRCDKADPKTLTFVELEFEYHGRHFFIRREPEQAVAKVHGSGLKIQKPTAFIEGDGIANRITKISDVDDKVKELLGLSYEQFRMTMMIAQGEFAQLIEADTKTRKGIFRTILSTQYLDRFTESLRVKASELKSTLNERRSNLDGQLASLDLDAPEIREKIHQPDYDLSLIMDAIPGALNQQKESLAPLEQASLESKAKHEEALKERERLANRNKDIQAYRAHKADFETLSSDSGKFEELRKEIKFAESSRPVYLKSRDFDNAKQRVAALEKNLEKAKADHKKSIEILNEKESTYLEALKKKDALDGLKEERSGCEKQIASFSETNALAKEVDKALKDFQQSKANFDKAQDSISSNEKLIRSIDERWKDFDHSELARRENACNAMKEKSKSLIALLERSNGLENFKARVKSAYQDEHAANLDSRETFEKWQSSYALLLHSQAGLLALDLEEGTPCPVCGSTSHPNLASTLDNAPSEAEIERLSKNKDSAESVRAQKEMERKLAEQNLENEYSSIISRYTELTGKDATKDNVAAAIQEATAEVNRSLEGAKVAYQNAHALQNSFADDKKKRDSLEKENLSQKERLAALENELRESKTAFDQKKGVLDEKKKSLEGLDEEKLSHRLKELSAQISDIEKRFGEAEKQRNAAKSEESGFASQSATYALQLESAKAEAANEETLLKDVVSKSGCLDLATALSHYRSDDVLASLRKTVTEFDTRFAAAKSLYENDLAKHLNDAVEVSLEEIDQDVAAKKFAADSDAKNYAESLSRYKRNTEIFEKAAADYAKIADLGKQSAEANALYMAASGTLKGSARVDFETYCMLSTFDRILRIATRKFLQMSDGRYEFRRRTSSGGSGRQGLDIDIFDHYSGVTRVATTLSGGEKFEASLALALSFSEAIQQSAGGVELDSMFIDEGFGTLSPDFADRAIKVLKELGRSNKLIGVISHIEQLEQQIDTKVEVHRSDWGISYIKIVA